jgi:hypothetical protein
MRLANGPLQIVQHLLDWERILTYRTLLCLREVGKSPQSLEQDERAQNSIKFVQPLEVLVTELIALRHSTRLFFHGIDHEGLQKIGTNWKYQRPATMFFIGNRQVPK